MRTIVPLILALLACGAPAAAAEPPLRAITVGASASVPYVPDLAHITLVVAAEAPTANDATASVDRNAQNVLTALRRAGVGESGLQTSNFQLTYRARTERGGVITPAAYLAQLTINATTTVAKIGPAIDEAIRAGANRSYDLGFESSHANELYLQALAAATAQAHAQAQAIARAAGVTLDALVTVNTSGGPARPFAAMARVAAPSLPVAPGTRTVDASVEAVYGIH